jgi:hypothetical protein
MPFFKEPALQFGWRQTFRFGKLALVILCNEFWTARICLPYEYCDWCDLTRYMPTIVLVNNSELNVSFCSYKTSKIPRLCPSSLFYIYVFLDRVLNIPCDYDGYCDDDDDQQHTTGYRYSYYILWKYTTWIYNCILNRLWNIVNITQCDKPSHYKDYLVLEYKCTFTKITIYWGSARVFPVLRGMGFWIPWDLGLKKYIFCELGMSNLTIPNSPSIFCFKMAAQKSNMLFVMQ